MTTIKATCPVCGEVSLTPADIDLRVDPTGAEPSSYGFHCPGCDEEVRKPADDRVVRLLVSGGVEPQHPADEECLQPLGRFQAPPLTHDDLLDFHAILERDDWYQLLLSSAPER